jgi:hypothetical protein
VELHNLYASSSMRMIKSIRMKWTGHVAQRGDRRDKCIGYWLANRKERQSQASKKTTRNMHTEDRGTNEHD